MRVSKRDSERERERERVRERYREREKVAHIMLAHFHCCYGCVGSFHLEEWKERERKNAVKERETNIAVVSFAYAAVCTRE